MDIQNMHACIQPSQGAAPQSDPAGCSIHDLLDDNDKTLAFIQEQVSMHQQME